MKILNAIGRFVKRSRKAIGAAVVPLAGLPLVDLIEGDNVDPVSWKSVGLACAGALLTYFVRNESKPDHLPA